MADHGGRAIGATLTGAAVLPGPGDPAAQGFVNLSANGGKGEICFAVDVDGIHDHDAPFGPVHIHRGGVTEYSTAVEVLLKLDLDGNAYGRGCLDAADGVPGAFVREVKATPAAFYVDVHYAGYPEGGVRGQLGYQKQPYK